MHACAYLHICSLPASCVDIYSHACSANYNSSIKKFDLLRNSMKL